MAATAILSLLGMGITYFAAQSFSSVAVVSGLTLLMALVGICDFLAGFVLSAYALKLLFYVPFEGKYIVARTDAGPLKIPEGMWQPLMNYWSFIWRELVFYGLGYAALLLMDYLFDGLSLYVILPLVVIWVTIINFALFHFFLTRERGLRFALVEETLPRNATKILHYAAPFCICAMIGQIYMVTPYIEALQKQMMESINEALPEELDAYRDSYHSLAPECKDVHKPKYDLLMQASKDAALNPEEFGSYFQMSGDVLYRVLFRLDDGPAPQILFMGNFQNMLPLTPFTELRVSPEWVKKWQRVSAGFIGLPDDSRFLAGAIAPDGSEVKYTSNLRQTIRAFDEKEHHLAPDGPGYYVHHPCFAYPLVFPEHIVLTGNKEWLGWVVRPENQGTAP